MGDGAGAVMGGAMAGGRAGVGKFPACGGAKAALGAANAEGGAANAALGAANAEGGAGKAAVGDDKAGARLAADDDDAATVPAWTASPTVPVVAGPVTGREPRGDEEEVGGDKEDAGRDEEDTGRDAGEAGEHGGEGGPVAKCVEEARDSGGVGRGACGAGRSASDYNYVQRGVGKFETQEHHLLHRT